MKSGRISYIILGLAFFVVPALFGISLLTPAVEADSVIATIPVGDAPTEVAFNANNGDMYVANHLSGTVSVIDGQTNTVIGNPVPVGTEPFGISFNANNGDMYVTSQINCSGIVSVIDGQTNTVNGSPIPVGDFADVIAFNANNGDMYVTSLINGNGVVSVIGGQTNTVIGSPIQIGNPRGIAFNANNGNMYVTNGSLSSGTVSVIDGQTNTVIGNPVPVGDDPVGIAFNANNGNMYVTNQTPNTVTVIDGQTNTVIANPIPVGEGPLGIAFNANNGNMYTANSASNTVSVISTSPIPSPFIDTAITSAVDGNNSPVANNTGSTVSNKITFTFMGTGNNNNNNIAGFQCSLDAPAFSSCTTPKTYENLGIGDHTFNIRAVDLLGNKDTTPASFSWKVLTPAQGIQKLIDDINNNPSIAKRVMVVLTGRLQAAITLLTDNNPKNDVAVCALMDSFTKIVNIYNKNGLLTLFQASQLNQQATAIKNSLGCSVMTGFLAVYPIIPISLTRNG